MLASYAETNWKLWNIWNNRVDSCKKEHVHIINPADFRPLCARHNNSGSAILTLNNHSYNRCNIFNCPLGPLK